MSVFARSANALNGSYPSSGCFLALAKSRYTKRSLMIDYTLSEMDKV